MRDPRSRPATRQRREPASRSRTTRRTSRRRRRRSSRPPNATRFNSATPTLTATFSDPDPNDIGKVTFQVCSDAACTSSLGTFDSTSTSIANGANGSASVPGGTITSDGTYYWRAKNVDSSAASSSFSATRSFIVDTTPPTIASAAVAADGDDASPSPGRRTSTRRRRSPAPRSRSTASPARGTVTYPAANQTQFTLSSAPSTTSTCSALDYTKPGSDPMIRDTATPDRQPGRDGERCLGHEQHREPRARRRRRSCRPRTPRRFNSATPTLTATFSDPDPNDTGKVTFEVCSDAACTSSLGTFDSTSTSIANGANGSASVPGGTITSDGTYYWRAKNVDSSAASSSFSATRSFIVDTTPPTIASAAVAADGTTRHGHLVREPRRRPGRRRLRLLDQRDRRHRHRSATRRRTRRRFTSPAPSTTSTCSTLDYTKPGGDPMIRDTATPTGNPAASASGISVTNNTADLAPSTPALVSPADASYANSRHADTDGDLQRSGPARLGQGHLRGLHRQLLLDLARHLRLDGDER